MDSVSLGLATDATKWEGGLTISDVSSATLINDDYKMRTGKRSHCTNEALEKTFSISNEGGRSLGLRLRAYNDGLAFQYFIPDALPGEAVTEEYTTYPIHKGTKRWIQNYEPAGYENFYPCATDGSKVAWRQKTLDWGYPALVEPDSSLFVLITEANIRRGHCGSYLNNDACDEKYRVLLPDEKVPIGGSSWESPWRLMITGPLASIVESTLVTDVSDPSTIEKSDWIVPGPVSWIYWAENHGSQDYKKVTEYMDLAESIGWQYDLIDAEWDLMRNGGNVDDALDYARKIGVKPMIWYNSSTNWVGPQSGAPTPYYRLNTPEAREKEFAWLKEKGVVGMKVDFFRGDKVEDMDYYIDLLEATAEQQLMINFHGATIPRGWQRTYPNMMSVEAVYGAEWYNNLPILTSKAAAHNATLPFTRNVVGPMDYTPGTFTDSQHPHITTHAHELALTVLFESALQHMPDRPSAYLSMPSDVKEFLSGLPTAWDDTRLLSGYPADHVVMARRSGDVWYIAGVNGTDKPRTLTFNLSRLFSHGDAAWLVKDGPQDREFYTSTYKLQSEDVSIKCNARGGFMMILK